jgi:hypothetical protein
MMKIKPSSKPFIVYLPGSDDNIGILFSPLIRSWQPFTAFRILPSEIESVSVENHGDSASSFLILNKGGVYSIHGDPKESAQYDSIKIKRYVSYFTNVPFEGWDFSPGDARAGSGHEPGAFMTIKVGTRGGDTISIQLYEKQKVENGKTIPDTDRLLGELNDGRGIFVMRYFDVDPILKKRSFFLRE